jgi:hypothetical protein
MVGLVALEAFGPGVALIALAIAACYPVFIELSATIYAENLLIPLELGAVWAALRVRRSEHPYRWVGLSGLLCGLATLTHLNAIVLLVALLAAVWRTKRAPALLVAATVLTVAPWMIRDAIVLHSFVPVSDETGMSLAGTYNPTSAADRQIPYKWTYYRNVPADAGLSAEAGRLTETELDSKLRVKALRYIERHPSAPFAAVYHNTRRLLELDGSFAWRASAYGIGVSTTTADVGVVSFWVVLLVAIVGAFTGFARRAPRWLWVIPALLFLSVVFVNGETPRFRAPIDPFLLLASACAVMTAVRGMRSAGWRALGHSPVRRHQLGPGPPTLRRQPIEVVERRARAERDAGQRRLRAEHRHASLLSDALGEPPHQRAPTDEQDSVPAEVRRQLWWRVLERVVDRLQDLANWTDHRLSDLLAAQFDARRQPGEQVASLDVEGLLMVERGRGADRDLDRLRGPGSDR